MSSKADIIILLFVFVMNVLLLSTEGKVFISLMVFNVILILFYTYYQWKSINRDFNDD